MSYKYSKEELTEYFFRAVDIFNERLETDISKKTMHFAFFMPQNGQAVYESFCKAYFPRYLSERYTEEGYFEEFTAQAFVGESEYGVMIREDIDCSEEELDFILLHEISHLFCTRNEMKGDRFFDKYCKSNEADDEIENGMMNAGYAVWREAVADIMADSIISEYATLFLKSKPIREEINGLYAEVLSGGKSAKRAMSSIISYVMPSREVAAAKDWKDVKLAIRRSIQLDDEWLFEIFELVFQQMHRHPFWEITPDFIFSLGRAYLLLIASNKANALSATQ